MEVVPSSHADDLHTAISLAAGLAPAKDAVRDTPDGATSSSQHRQPLSTSTSTPPQTRVWEHRGNEAMVTVARRDGRSPGRRMDDEAIAGTAVGVILGVALMVCCLYPVVVHYIKKRRRSKPYSWECEYGTTFRGHPPDRPRRLSSSDKTDDEGKTRHQNYSAPNGYVYPVDAPQGQARQTSTGYNASAPDSIHADPQPQFVPHNPDNFSTPFPYYQDVVPPPPPAGPNHFVLKGTSEDYYSPYVPSEAFGMYPAPAPVLANPSEPQRSAQRDTSLRHNVRSLFRRQAVPEQSEAVPSLFRYSDYPHPPNQQLSFAPPSTDSVPSTQLYSTESMDVITLPSQYSSYHRAPGSTVDGPALRGLTSQDSLEPSTSTLDFSLDLPVFGTVNPMDIMPPATESEMWHRVDYQLYSSSNQDSPPEMPSSLEADGFTAAPVCVVSSAPSMAEPIPVPVLEPLTKLPPVEDVISTQQPLPPLMGFESIVIPSSRPTSTLKTTQAVSTSTSRLSSQPNSAPRPSSTNPSSLSTPSTHGDSPSPGSLNSSDYRQSISPPNGLSDPSPKTGVYHCDERGCNQFFDQPHKLKHHQRYHSKDHKCPYPTCGKGFGTKTHLQRHINDRHEKKKKFHCSMNGCDYSRTGGKAFPRKDNWKRHMVKIHGMDHSSLPEPVEVDHDMLGV